MRTGPDALSEEPDKETSAAFTHGCGQENIEEDLEGAMGKEGDRLMSL